MLSLVTKSNNQKFLKPVVLRSLFIPILFLLLLFSCTRQERPSAAIPTNLTGIFEPSLDSMFVIKYDDYTFDIHVIDGRFDIELPIYDPTYAWLILDEETVPLYILPGHSLEIRLEQASDGYTIEFQGKAAESNKYLVAHQRFARVNQPDFATLFASDEMGLKQELRRFRSKEFAFHKKYLRKNINLDPNFMTGEKARILYRWGLMLHQYYSMHADPNKRPPLLAKEKSFDYKNELNLNEGRFIGIPEYDSYVKSTVLSNGQNRSRDIENHTFADAAFEIIETIQDQDVKDFALEVVMKQILTKESHPEHEMSSLLDHFLAGCQNGDRIYRIQTLYDRWLSLVPGKKAPPITFIDRLNVHRSIDDLRGKPCYIFLWSDTLDHEQMCSLWSSYDDLPDLHLIDVFIGTSETWPDADFFAPTCKHQWRLDPSQLKYLEETYLIKDLPSAVLIDGQGRIIDSKAPLPGDPTLFTGLQQLLTTS